MALITKAANWEKIYIFISSTFNDMHAERDYLVKNVFPELGEWCDRRKLRMVDIDLRWGVTEADATQNKNVVNVCLNRIDECRPFFLCFLGQRYGWVPERKDVSPETFQKFPGLEETMNRGASVTELEVLHSIISPFHSEQTIKKRRYNPSHFSFFYFRDETYLNDLPKELPYLRRIYSDSEEEDEHAREVLRGKKNVLNQRIANAQRPCHKYQARWSREHKTPEIAIPLQCPATLEENQIRWRREWLKCADVHVSGLDVEEEAAEAAKAREFNDRLTAGRLIDLECEGRELGDTVVEELKAAIQDRFPRHREREDPDELQREIDQQEQFVFINSEGFIKRTGDFDELDAYAESSSNKLFVLTAEAGMGKSTLLANWVDNYRTAIQDEPARSVHFRFIGASDGSTTVYSLLRLLLRELKEANDQIDDEIPDDPQKLRRAFPEFLKKTGQKWKTVIVLDALDQLELGLSDLDWLPRRLPDGIKLIVSFKRGEKDAENLYDSFAKDDRVQMAGVRPFKERKDQRKLIEAYLSQYLKELDQRHIDSLIDSEAAQNPLYLKVVLSELRVFGAFPNLGEKIRQDFGTNPVSAFNAVLARLERDPAYTTIPPSEAVPLLFGLLANARSGLTVEELAGIFTQTLDLEDTPQAREAAADAVYFFLRQTRPFLGRRDGRHDFFYKSFKTAARMRYEGETTTEFPGRRPARAWHGLLAHCFFSKADPAGDGSWSGSNPHGLSELPFHLAGAECWQDLKATLLNYRFLQAKVTALGPQPLIDDFDRTLKEGPGDDNLRSIRDVLRLSSASLAKDPDQLTGQLTGRLMGLDMPELEALVESAQRWAASPWLRPLTPSLERPGGPLQRTVQAHDDDIETVVVLPDGCRAVSGSKDCRLKLWDLETGRLLREHLLVGERKKVWRDHPSDAKTRDTWEVLALATSTDCRNLILGCGDSTARLWDVEAWREVRVFQGHSQPVYAVAFTPDGEFAITGSADKTLRVWRILTGEVIRVFEGHDSVVSSLAVTPDGRHVISGAEDKTIRIWELASGRQLVRLRGHQGLVRAVAVTPDGKYVLSGSDDCSIMVWDVCRAAASQQGRSPRAMRMLLGHTYPVVALAVDPGGRFAFSGATDCMLKVWDLEDWIEAATLRGHGGRVLALAPSADGRRLVSGDGLGRLCIWDLGRIDETQKGSGHFGPVLDLAVTPDGRLAVSASDDRTIRVWDAGNMTEVACLRGHDKGVFSVAVSPDSRHAVSGGRDNQLLIWDLRRGKRVRTVPIPGAFDEQHSGGPATTKENIVHQIDVTPDGRFAVTGLSDGSVRVWKLHDRLPWWLSLLRGVLRLQVERYRFQGHSGPVRTVAVTPDGRHLVSGADDKTIKLWSLQTGKEIRTLHEHSDSVSHVDVTHDGRFLVSSSWDASIILWDLDSGRCLHKLKGHGRLVRQVKTTPSGRHALSASADGSAILWNLAEAEAEARFTGDTQLTACAAFPDNSTFIVGDQAGGVHFLRAEGITGDHHDYYREAQSPEHRPHKPPPVRLPAVPMLNWSGVISMAIPAMLAMLLNFYTAVYSDRLLRWAFSRLPLIAGTRWVFFAISVAWLLAYLVIGAQYSIESNYSAAGFWVAPWTGYTLKWRAIFLGWPLNFLVPWGLSIGAAWIAHERWDMPFGILALALFGVLTLIWVRAYVRALV